jgi:DNA-binding beta-propeller fold protein YncE
VLGVMLLGCVAPTGKRSGSATEPAPRVWPPPPAEPRIAFERSIAAASDLGLRESWLGRAASAFTGGQRGREAFVKPFGIALDEAGNLCLTDTGANAVCFFDLERRRCWRWDQAGKVRFVSPVAVAKQDGVIYLADSGAQRVLAFGEDGKLRFQIAAPLQRPAGVVIAGERLYVADSEAHCIAVFDRRGRFQFTFGTRGVGPGEFNFPTHLAADAQGRLYVTDSMNSRVEIFDSSGRFLSEIGSLGDGSGHFSRPKGVAVDDFGRVYVADALFDNFQVFDAAGQFLLDVGAAGSGPGEFWMPAGIAVGRDGRVYVADSYNCRLQVFRYVGSE